LTFETYKRGNDIETAEDQFTVVTKKFEYRPDLLSNAVYGTPDYWWRIMEVNKIWDIYEFRAGLNIRIPFNLGSQR
jgi:hypothetical protein